MAPDVHSSSPGLTKQLKKKCRKSVSDLKACRDSHYHTETKEPLTHAMKQRPLGSSHSCTTPGRNQAPDMESPRTPFSDEISRVHQRLTGVLFSGQAFTHDLPAFGCQNLINMCVLHSDPNLVDSPFPTPLTLL